MNSIYGLDTAEERIQFSSVQSLSRVRLFATPWITARQASLCSTNSQSPLRLTSIKSVMPSSHLILCRPLLLLPPITHSIRVFSNESTLCMRWPKYWSFSLLFFLNFILFLNFTILYWFCQILKWICHRYTCVPHPEPSSLLPPHTLWRIHFNIWQN